MPAEWRASEGLRLVKERILQPDCKGLVASVSSDRPFCLTLKGIPTYEDAERLGAVLRSAFQNSSIRLDQVGGPDKLVLELDIRQWWRYRT